MNKEEIIIGFFEKGWTCDLDEVKDICLGLLKENKQLKEKLNRLEDFIYNKGCYRTIEKIENGEYALELGEYSTYKTKDLLEVLKGKENE